MSVTTNDIITSALLEIGGISPGESVDAALMNFGLSKLNRMIDSWDAQERYIYTVQFVSYNLIALHQPHTIGLSTNTPAPDWVTTANRPVKIETAVLVINTATPNYNIPINIRDDDWWASQRIQGLQTSYPTDLYYTPAWPNGECFFWPVPTVAYPVQLRFWTSLTQFTLAQTFSLPPGYWDAIVYSLAESMLPAIPPEEPSVIAPLLIQAAKARDAIQVLNIKSPRISTGGDGLPSGGLRPSFDWRTGFNVGTWSGSGR